MNTVLPYLQFGWGNFGNLSLDLWSLATKGTQEFSFRIFIYKHCQLWIKNLTAERVFTALRQCELQTRVYCCCRISEFGSSKWGQKPFLLLPSCFPLATLLLSPCYPLAFPLAFLLFSSCYPLATPLLPPCYPLATPLLSACFPLPSLYLA